MIYLLCKKIPLIKVQTFDWAELHLHTNANKLTSRVINEFLVSRCSWFHFHKTDLPYFFGHSVMKTSCFPLFM